MEKCVLCDKEIGINSSKIINADKEYRICMNCFKKVELYKNKECTIDEVCNENTPVNVQIFLENLLLDEPKEYIKEFEEESEVEFDKENKKTNSIAEIIKALAVIFSILSTIGALIYIAALFEETDGMIFYTGAIYLMALYIPLAVLYGFGEIIQILSDIRDKYVSNKE